MHRASRTEAYALHLKHADILHGTHHHLHSLWNQDRAKHFAYPPFSIAYNGESLDYKAPLLKSIDALNKAAVDVMSFL